MRTYPQLLDAILAAWPTAEEIDQLDEKQIANLRGAGNCYDNVLFLATERGIAVVAEARASEAQEG